MEEAVAGSANDRHTRRTGCELVKSTGDMESNTTGLEFVAFRSFVFRRARVAPTTLVRPESEETVAHGLWSGLVAI